MADLTPAEQRFFETGELTPDIQPTVPVVPEPAKLDPLDLAALGNHTPPVVDTPVVDVKVPVVDAPVVDQPQVVDATEILRRSLAEAQQRVGVLEQHIHQVTQQPVQQEAAPDPTTDPLGAMMHQLATVNKTVADLQARLLEQQTQQANQQAFVGFQQQVRALRDEFVKTHADFPDAYQHLRSIRENDLKIFGLNDQQIRETIFREEAAVAENAIRSARNPAEVMYDMARRHGFAGKVAVTPTPPQTPDAKLQAAKQAQSAARNLPQTPVNESVSVEGLKEASDADLNKLVMDSASWRKIVGGDQYPL